MSEELALFLAFVFAVFYDMAFTRWGQRQQLTVFWVIGGVAATLFFASIVNLPPKRYHLFWDGREIVLTNAQHAALHTLKFFIATGIPMFLGAIRRWWATVG